MGWDDGGGGGAAGLDEEEEEGGWGLVLLLWLLLLLLHFPSSAPRIASASASARACTCVHSNHQSPRHYSHLLEKAEKRRRESHGYRTINIPYLLCPGQPPLGQSPRARGQLPPGARPVEVLHEQRRVVRQQEAELGVRLCVCVWWL